MKLLRVGAAVLNQTPLDWEGNTARARQAIELAREQGVSVLCLPELCLTGYGCEDAFPAPGTQEQAWRSLQELLPATKGMVVSFGLPLLYAGGLFNTACLVADRKILGFVAKQNLAGEGIHYEPRWFKPWPKGVRAEIELAHKLYPIGDLIFDCGGVRIGFEICEDAWVAERPGAYLAREAVDVILNPSASHFAFGKHEVRLRFVIEGSRAFSVAYVYANLLGNEAGRAIYDGDAMIASAGTLLATGPRFSYADCHVTSAVVNIETIRLGRARTGSFRPSITSDAPRIIDTDFNYPALSPTPSVVTRPGWENSPWIKEEEFTRAVSLSLFDYLRKSRSRGFVVSLSGGADSTACSLLSAWLADFGMQELGREAFLHKLGYLSELQAAQSPREVTKKLLTCVYQATRNSGEVTRNAAEVVAEGIGAEFLQFDVDALVQEYIRVVSQAIGRELTWEQDDIALQNIQARTRSPSVWLLTNIRGALLLSTSNRSEAAVGYATMDGDTSGGLAPIAGIDKAFLRRWLRWVETHGPEGIGPTPAVNAVNEQQPTAELRPSSANQTDEADLMPYELLDAVERLAIRDKMSPLDILQRVRVDFPMYELRPLSVWVDRFFRLWCRNQWKRERYAPSFHLDDENLDPRSWCRFPILSGGYQRELGEMWDWAEGQMTKDQ